MSGQGHNRFFLAVASSHTMIKGRQIIVFGVGNSPGHFKQDGSQIGVAFGGFATQPLPRALLVSAFTSLCDIVLLPICAHFISQLRWNSQCAVPSAITLEKSLKEG